MKAYITRFEDGSLAFSIRLADRSGAFNAVEICRCPFPEIKKDDGPVEFDSEQLLTKLEELSLAELSKLRNIRQSLQIIAHVDPT